MKDYVLFIDTETTGIPQDFNSPYANDAAWPHSVQVAWVVYTKYGQQVKAENHYVRNDGFEISEGAEKIHGITSAFLEVHGEDRKFVFELLAADLNKYRPLVVGHFMELDYHMAGVGFYRSGLDNPMASLPTFCTMQASASYLIYTHRRSLRLGELYERLFGKPLEHHHNALADALATAKCFFQLHRRGDISDAAIEAQQTPKPEKKHWYKGGCSLSVLFLLIIIFLSYWL
ncbi:3'-5' exonuclease [Pontibacter chitinilyticus]|uniref:3'-5' exonuclease n=1 Tax=Pontibacter chitinilyticus TaxID=2674989 RepID=UPI00321904BF